MVQSWPWSRQITIKKVTFFPFYFFRINGRTRTRYFTIKFNIFLSNHVIFDLSHTCQLFKKVGNSSSVTLLSIFFRAVPYFAKQFMIPFSEIYSQVFSLSYFMLLKFYNTCSHYCHYDIFIFISLSLCVLFLVESTLKQPLASIFQVFFSSNHLVNSLNSSTQTQPSDSSKNSLKISSSSVS